MEISGRESRFSYPDSGKLSAPICSSKIVYLEKTASIRNTAFQSEAGLPSTAKHRPENMKPRCHGIFNTAQNKQKIINRAFVPNKKPYGLIKKFS